VKRSRKMGLSLAALAAATAPVAGTLVAADIGPAAATSCGTAGHWSAGHSRDVFFFGTKIGSVSTATQWHDTVCDGDVDSWSFGYDSTITAGGWATCYNADGIDPVNTFSYEIPPSDPLHFHQYQGGVEGVAAFYWSLNGGACVLIGTMTTSGWSNGGNSLASTGEYRWSSTVSGSPQSGSKLIS